MLSILSKTITHQIKFRNMKTQTIQPTNAFFVDTDNTSTQKESISKSTISNRIVLTATMLLLLSGAALVYFLQPDFYNFNQSRFNSPLGLAFLAVTISLLLLTGSSVEPSLQDVLCTFREPARASFLRFRSSQILSSAAPTLLCR